MSRLDPRAPEGMIVWGSAACALILAGLLGRSPTLEDRWPGRCVQLRSQLDGSEMALRRAAPPPPPQRIVAEAAWPINWDGGLSVPVPDYPWHTVRLQRREGQVELILLAAEAQLFITPLAALPLHEQLSLLLGELPAEALQRLPSPSQLLRARAGEASSGDDSGSLAAQEQQLLQLAALTQPEELNCQRADAVEEVTLALALSLKPAQPLADDLYLLQDGALLSLQRGAQRSLWVRQSLDDSKERRWQVSWSLPHGDRHDTPLLQSAAAPIPAWGRLLERLAYTGEGWSALRAAWPAGAPALEFFEEDAARPPTPRPL